MLDGRFTVRLLIGILLILPIFCASQVAGHGHHGQSNVRTQERPSLKYTKEANEPKVEDNQHVHETADTSWIVPFTAGGFIYLGCRSIPELLEGSNLMQSLSEMITIFLTVYTMFLVNTS